MCSPVDCTLTRAKFCLVTVGAGMSRVTELPARAELVADTQSELTMNCGPERPGARRPLQGQ